MPSSRPRWRARTRFAAAVLLASPLVACSNGEASWISAATTADEAGLDTLLTAEASRLALGDDPRIDEETYRIAAAYSHIAKGFWIDERCAFSGEADASARAVFRANIAVATQAMRGIFENTDGIDAAEADRMTQSIQMRSLQEMSANQFFDCGPDAQAVYQYAVGEAAYWAQTAGR